MHFYFYHWLIEPYEIYKKILEQKKKHFAIKWEIPN